MTPDAINRAVTLLLDPRKALKTSNSEQSADMMLTSRDVDLAQKIKYGPMVVVGMWILFRMMSWGDPTIGLNNFSGLALDVLFVGGPILLSVMMSRRVSSKIGLSEKNKEKRDEDRELDLLITNWVLANRAVLDQSDEFVPLLRAVRAVRDIESSYAWDHEAYRDARYDLDKYLADTSKLSRQALYIRCVSEDIAVPDEDSGSERGTILSRSSLDSIMTLLQDKVSRLDEYSQSLVDLSEMLRRLDISNHLDRKLLSFPDHRLESGSSQSDLVIAITQAQEGIDAATRILSGK